MTFKAVIIVAIIGLSPVTGFTQKTDSLINKLDSLKKQTDTTGQTNKVEPGFYNEKTKITPKVFGILLLDDFKQQALSPFHVNKRGWFLGAGFAALTAGVGFLDKPIQQSAVRFRNNNPWSKSYSHTLTNIGGLYEVVPFAGIAAWGFVFKNEKLRTTTYLALQSYITSTVWSTIFKTLSGRTRPANFDPNSPQNEPRFHGPFYRLPYGGNSSFPSGHTTLAFAAATVYAKEYKYVPAVPIISYTVATLISLSRITENRHWATDVLTGAALGYLSGTQVVNNYHRYARLQRTKGNKQKKGKLTANIQYFNRQVIPGVVYSF
jgi:membrane-associated phospholipid phosphatase